MFHFLYTVYKFLHNSLVKVKLGTSGIAPKFVDGVATLRAPRHIVAVPSVDGLHEVYHDPSMIF